MRAAAIALAFTVWAAQGIVQGGEAAPALVASSDDRAAEATALDAIRGQIVALDIETALVAIEALLAKPGLAESVRAEALDLRAQAHVASDDLDAAEKDYRAILELRPDFAPNPELTSKRGMERFARVEAATVGRVHVDVDPRDAILFLDGRPVSRDGSGSFKAVAGERALRVERRGFDAAALSVHAVAGEETLLKVVLVPNARHLVVRTDVPGVVVTLDGMAVGTTARASGGAPDGSEPAELVIEDVGIGEHAILLEKSCFAAEALQEIVRVDLADRSPERLRVVTMRPARARVAAVGATYAGELRVDGEAVAALPVETFTMCPGRRELEVVASGRVVWSGTVNAGESDMTLDLSPRPNCALVGAEWPKTWGAAASAWSLRGRLDLPTGADLTTAAGWATVALPPGTDLALGVVPRSGVAGEDRVLLFAPALGVVEDRPRPPPVGRPDWSETSVGAVFVDSAMGVVAVAVSRGGPGGGAGLAPGDRVLSVDGKKVARASEVVAWVLAAAPGSKIVAETATPAGERRTLELRTVERPRVDGALAEGESAIVHAAWGTADAAAGGPEAPIALANLAWLLERAGRQGPALEAWRKLRAIAEENTVLAARADYALGVASVSAGAAAEAAGFFTRAKAEAEAGGEIGLASAAADRLADGGVAPR